MNLRSLRLQNFRRFHDVTFEPGDGVTAIIGRNGSGKSTLIEALGFALFGTRVTRTPNALIAHTEAAPSDPVIVTLQFELNGQAIEVVRELRGAAKSPRASVVVDGKTLVAPGANSNQAATQELERLLHMDRAAFLTTVVAQQKELARLADLPSAERKQMILRMLGIDNLDHAIKAARDKRRLLDERLATMRSTAPDHSAIKAALSATKLEATNLEKQFAEATAAQATASKQASAAQDDLRQAQQLATARQAVVAEVEQCKLRLSTFEDRAKALLTDRAGAQAASRIMREKSTAPQRRVDLQQQLETAGHAVATAKAHEERTARLDALMRRLQVHEQRKPASPDVAKVEAKCSTTTTKLGLAREQAAVIAAELTRLEGQLKRLREAPEDAPCPVCGRPLAGHREKLAAQLGQEIEATSKQAKEGADQVAQATNADGEARAALAAAQVAKQELDAHAAERARLGAEVEQLQSQLGEVPPPPPDMQQLRIELEAATRDEHDFLRAQESAAKLPDIAARLETATMEAEAERTKLAKLSTTLDDLAAPDTAPLEAHVANTQAEASRATQVLHATETALQLAKQKLEQLNQQLEDSSSTQATIKSTAAELQAYTAIAGGRGAGLLERFRSHLVGKIRPAINDEASRLLSKFTQGRYNEVIVDEDYGIFVVDGTTPYTLDRFSGGETDVVHLALRLAVSRLLAHRTGAPEMRFLALDEVFGSLDDSRRDAVLGALHGLGDLYRQVLLVTHHEALRDLLDSTLEVRQKDSESILIAHQG